MTSKYLLLTSMVDTYVMRNAMDFGSPGNDEQNDKADFVKGRSALPNPPPASARSQSYLGELIQPLSESKFLDEYYQRCLEPRGLLDEVCIEDNNKVFRGISCTPE